MQFNAKKLKEINFIEIIKESFIFAWQKKYLWWFGLLIVLGNFGSFNFSFDSEEFEENQEVIGKAISFISAHQNLFIAIVIILILLFILFFILSILGKGALIKTIYIELEVGKSNFKTGLKFGKKFFWKLLTLTALTFFFIIGILLIMAIPIVFLIFSGVIVPAIILIIIAFLILIPLFFLVYFLLSFSRIYLVLGNLSIKQSLENAYSLLRKNIAPSLVLFFILAITGIIFFFCTIIILIPFIIIFTLLGLLLYFLLKITGIIITVSIAIPILLIIFFILRSFYKVFHQTVWIKFFQIIAKPKVVQEIVIKIPESKLEPTPNIVE